MDHHPTEPVKPNPAPDEFEGQNLDDLLSSGKAFSNWKEERLYREKWGMQAGRSNRRVSQPQGNRIMNWEAVGEYEDIHYHKSGGIASYDQLPAQANAFRPKTVSEMYAAFLDAGGSQNWSGITDGAGPHTDGRHASVPGRSECGRGWICG